MKWRIEWKPKGGILSRSHLAPKAALAVSKGANMLFLLNTY